MNGAFGIQSQPRAAIVPAPAAGNGALLFRLAMRSASRSSKEALVAVMPALL